MRGKVWDVGGLRLSANCWPSVTRIAFPRRSCVEGGVGRVVVDEEGRFIIGVNGESWYVTRYPLFQCFTLPGIEVLERTVIGEGGGNS